MTKRNKKKEITKQSARAIIEEILGDYSEDIGFKSFRHAADFPRENTFSFVIKLIPLELMIVFLEEERIKEVFFNPLFPPPGGAMCSISLRYRVYVEFK